MFQTPYQESQLVYLRSKFIHKLRNTFRGGECVCVHAKYYGQLQGGGGSINGQKTIT